MKAARTVSSLSLVAAATVKDRYAQAAPIQPTAEMTCTVSTTLRARRPSILELAGTRSAIAESGWPRLAGPATMTLLFILDAPRRPRLWLALGPPSAEDQCEDASEELLRRRLFVHQALERQAVAQGPHRPRQVARVDRGSEPSTVQPLGQ